MCEWRSNLDPDYRCKVPPEPGSKYCIFHEPGKKDVEKFKKKFYAQIDASKPKHKMNPRFDFTGYFFPTSLAATGKASETKALVLPKCITGNLLCNEVKVNGKIEFDEAIIEGNAYFDHARTDDSIYFYKTTIKGHAYFRSGEIKGTAHFGEAIIKGDVSFGGVVIKEDAYFYRAAIEGDVYFEKAEITGTVDFDKATIKGHAYFNEVMIGARALFRATMIAGTALFEKAIIYSHISFNEATFESDTSFAGATIKGDAYFESAIFRRRLSFENTSFENRTGFAVCHAGGLDLGHGKPTILWWSRKRSGVNLHNIDTGKSFWHFARVTFEKEGRREKADAAYYFERIWQRKSSLAGTCSQRIRGILSYLLDYLFLRLPIAYGVSIFRTITTWIAVILGFALAYATCPSLLDTTSSGLWTVPNWATALYFSVTTFTTLGLGDVQPARLLGKVVISVEAALGGLLMALTVVVISRKFMR